MTAACFSRFSAWELFRSSQTAREPPEVDTQSAMTRGWGVAALLLLCAASVRADIQEEVLDHDDRSIILIAR